VGLLRKLWDRLVSGAAEELGEAEERVGGPLYPVTAYAADVYPGVLIRGSWPSKERLVAMWGRGVRAVVNLCSERVQDEEVRAAGLRPINIPIRDNTVPTQQQVTDFLLAVDFRAPVYVHCEAGKGRTGCMVAAFRVLVQGWEPRAALDEAERFGLGVPAQRDWILGLGKGAR
jgi:hypothetical protein